MRVVARQPARLESPGMFVADSSIGYRLAPSYSGYRGNRVEYMNRIRTDTLGMRTDPDGARVNTSGEADSGVPILVLGDSFIFGQGVEAREVFSTKLEQRLRADGISAKVLNAGVPGYGLREEASWLSRFGGKIHPRLVIIGIYLGNDLVDGLRNPAQRLRDGGVTAPATTWHTPISAWLYAHSHLYDLAREGAVRIAMLLRPGHAGELEVGDQLVSPDPAARKAETDSAAAALDDLLRSAASLESATFAFFIPQIVQVETWRLRDLPRRVAIAGPVDLTYPNRIFSRLLVERNVPFLDLTSPFQEAARQGDTLYLPIDRHWTLRGHELAAALVARVIESSLRDVADRAATPAPHMAR